MESSYWLIDGISNEDADIAATEVLGDMSKLFKIFIGDIVRSVAHAFFEHSQSRFEFGEGYVDSSLESTTDGGIECPGKVGCSQY